MKHFSAAIITLLFSFAALANDDICELSTLDGEVAAYVDADGSIGRPWGSGVQFIGKTSYNPTNRKLDVFGNPEFLSRGGVVTCYMISGGRVSESDGAVYDFHYRLIGWIGDEGSIYDRSGETVGHYSNSCARYPASARNRFVGSGALLTLLHRSGDSTSRYWLSFDPAQCRW